MLLSRPGRFTVSPRVVAILLAAVAHLTVAAALLLAPLAVLELMDPPQAKIDIIYRPPRPPAGGSSAPGGGVRPPRPAPQPSPAQPPRVPLAPPAALTPPAEPRPVDPPSRTAADPGAIPAGLPEGSGTGPGGGGDADGGGGSGPGAGCAGCPPGPGVFDADPNGITREDDPRVTPPVLVPGTRALPRYPAAARRARVRGDVVLRIVIEADGRVGAIEVLRGPDPRFGFDLEAIEAVKQWRYRPALLDGRPVAAYARVFVEFTLVD